MLLKKEERRALFMFFLMFFLFAFFWVFTWITSHDKLSFQACYQYHILREKNRVGRLPICTRTSLYPLSVLTFFLLMRNTVSLLWNDNLDSECQQSWVVVLVFLKYLPPMVSKQLGIKKICCGRCSSFSDSVGFNGSQVCKAAAKVRQSVIDLSDVAITVYCSC